MPNDCCNMLRKASSYVSKSSVSNLLKSVFNGSFMARLLSENPLSSSLVHDLNSEVGSFEWKTMLLLIYNPPDKGLKALNGDGPQNDTPLSLRPSGHPLGNLIHIFVTNKSGKMQVKPSWLMMVVHIAVLAMLIVAKTASSSLMGLAMIARIPKRNCKLPCECRQLTRLYAHLHGAHRCTLSALVGI